MANEKKQELNGREKALRQQAALEEKRKQIAKENQTKKTSLQESLARRVEELTEEQKREAEGITTNAVTEPVAGKTVKPKTKKISVPKPVKTVQIEEQLPIQDVQDEESKAAVSRWFMTICWMRIPFVGFIYALVLSFRKKETPARKFYARAYVLYRMVVLLLSIVVLYAIYKVGLNFVDDILGYVK